MFTSLQDPGDDPLSIFLPALIAPLSAPLWQGETRTFSPTPQEYKFLSSMSQSNQSPTFVHIGSQRGELVGANEAAIAGSVGTEAILLDLSMLSVTILGVGHLKVASVVAERPFRVVRGRRAYDEAATGSTDELRAKATALWDAASGCSRRIQAARLQARLRMLGGAASAALLAIPMADQLELQRSAGGASSTAPARAVRPPAEVRGDSGEARRPHEGRERRVGPRHVDDVDRLRAPRRELAAAGLGGAVRGRREVVVAAQHEVQPRT